MKLSLLIVASTAACSKGFVILNKTTRTACAQTSSSLEMNGGFLNGRDKSDIMKNEDDAMWVDDGDGDAGAGWNPFGKKKAAPAPAPKKAAPEPVAKPTPVAKMQNPFAPKKKVEVPKEEPIQEAPKKAGFKFPWDK
mmetsp:Transcript_13735/g.20637  ORF Transcript_13735/g.20637 Transcript_13735/m.20637 type:complete len:137 (-) Transcript_13735:39-449(-)